MCTYVTATQSTIIDISTETQNREQSHFKKSFFRLVLDCHFQIIKEKLFYHTSNMGKKKKHFLTKKKK